MGTFGSAKGDEPGNKGRTFPPEPLTSEEVKALMDVCSRRAPTGRRDRALICILWRGQLRVSEALALKAADFDPAACTLRVLKGKGDKARVVVIDRQAAAHGDGLALVTARLIASAALARRESRGAHFRSDFPARLAHGVHSRMGLDAPARIRAA